MKGELNGFIDMYSNYLEKYVFGGGTEEVLLDAYQSMADSLDEYTAQAANILDIHHQALREVLGVRRDNDMVQWIYIQRATEFLAQVLIITDAFLLALREGVERDPLTGLYNRLAFERLLQNFFSQAKTGNFPLAVAMLDIDNFKDVNDTYGHLVGDQILKRLASILTESLRGDDTVVRFGGEEFLLILPGTSYEKVSIPLRRIRENISREHFPEVGSITVSIGVTEVTKDLPANLEELIRFADRAMYEAKLRGKDRIFYYKDLNTGPEEAE